MVNSFGLSLLYEAEEQPQKNLSKGNRRQNQSSQKPEKKGRVIQRKAKRIKRLVRLLQEKKILPFNQSEKNEIYLLDPYELRAEGLNQKLNPQELARVFLHLCKRRGFLSNRKTTFLELFKNRQSKKN